MNFDSNYVRSFYTASWKDIQAIISIRYIFIFNLPSEHSYLLLVINDTLPIDVMLTQRCIKFN